MVHCVDVCTGRYFQVQPGLPRPRTHETEVSHILKTGSVFRAPMITARPFTCTDIRPVYTAVKKMPCLHWTN